MGAIYGLIALGFSVIFYVTQVIQFGHGQVVMIGIMVAAAAAGAGLPVEVVVILGILASTAISVVVYFVGVRPVLSKGRNTMATLVTTLGLALLFESGAALIWGTSSRPFPNLLNNTSLHIGSATLTLQELTAIVVGVVLALAVEVLRRRTLYGKLGMAVAVDPEMATGVGINTRAIAVGAFVIAGFLAGVAAILVGPRSFGNPYLGETYGIDGFVALMIAGTDRPLASLVGGFILGVAEQCATGYINTQAGGWFPFVLVIAVLVILPRGLFATGNPLDRAFGAMFGRLRRVPVGEA